MTTVTMAGKNLLGNKTNEPTTSDVKTQESLKNIGASSSKQNNEEYQIGDIIWAKIGKYPYWPSIVCSDPDSKTFMKGSPDDKKTFALHVRFCHDNGRRNWVRILHKYSGKYELLFNYPNALSCIKNKKKQTDIWNMAVTEADYWLTLDREERWKTFSKKNNIISPPAIPIKLPECILSTSGTTPIKLPDSIPSTSGTSSIELSTNTNTTTEKMPSFKVENTKRPKNKLKRTKKIKKEEPFNFIYSEDYFGIDDDGELLTHSRREVLKQFRHDVEAFEAEGIRKIREWRASKH